MVTFVQTTYALATFVHITNISAVTGPILTKLFGLHFLGGMIFVDLNLLGPNFIKTHFFFEHQFFRAQIFSGPKIFFKQFFPTKNFFGPNIFLDPNFFRNPIFFQEFFSVPKVKKKIKPKVYLGPNIFLFTIFIGPKKNVKPQIFQTPKFFQTQNFSIFFADQEFLSDPKFC